MDNFDPRCDVKVTLDCLGAIIPGGEINLLFLSQQGVREDDGETDYADEFEAAVNKAIAQKKVLILDLQQIRIKRVLRWVYPAFTQIRMYSFTDTKIIFDCPSDGAWSIQGTQISQGDPVKFNSGGGYNKVDFFPYSRPSEDTDRGWWMKIDDVSDIQPGYIVKIQTQQLPLSEHRYGMSVGETNRVRAVTADRAVEFDVKLRHSYRVGPIHSTTVAAVTDTSVTLTDAPPAGITPERLLITFANGETRFGQWYDEPTKTLSWPVGGTWDQLPLSVANDNTADGGGVQPLPVVGSAVTLSADPYVFLYAPIYVTMSGFTIVNGNADVMHRGLAIAMVDNLIMEDVYAEGFQAWGMSFTLCFEPQMRFSKHDRSIANALGYTTLWGECRGGMGIGFRSHNNRRMSDTGATCQSIGQVFTDFQINGGWKNDIGQEWEFEGPYTDDEPEEFNYGIGEHGQALDWIWRNGVIRDVKTPILFRGGGERIENIKVEGFPAQAVLLGAGYGRSIDGLHVSDGLNDTELLDSRGGLHWQEYETPTLIWVEAFKFARSGFGYVGPADIRNVTIQGALKNLIYFNVGGENGVVIPDWAVVDITFRTQKAIANATLFKAGLSTDSTSAEIARLSNWTVTDIVTYFLGDSSAIMTEGRCVVLAPNSWMRVGYGRFRFRLDDDAVLVVPSLAAKSQITPGNLLRISMFTTAPITAVLWFADLLINPNGNTIAVEFTPTSNVLVMDPALIGVSDPDGTLNIGLDTSGVRLRNRLGGPIFGMLEVRV